MADGGQIWAGLTADPFFGNGSGLEQFLQTLFEQGRFDPAAFVAMRSVPSQECHRNCA